jgi:stearoyl-CoA desaturase (delta-9 desaturase)
LAHWRGYRNGVTKDQSRNISPWGIVVGGEELHNNHHLDPGSAKLSRKPWEFDIGWMYIRILSGMGLAQIKTV